MANHNIPKRSEVPIADRWDLSALFPSGESWENGLKELASMQAGIGVLRAKFSSSREDFLALLTGYAEYLRLDERLAYYSDLRVTEDEGDSGSRGRYSRYVGVAAAGQAAWAWLTPSIQALPEAFLDSCFADPRFADYGVFLKKLIRFKPHILSEKEERLLAMQAETNHTAQETFGVLTNVDLDFGTIRTDEGLLPLSQSTFSAFMRSQDREIRRKAYLKLYGAYERHKTTLASLYAGSVKIDKYQAQVRGYESARAQALFPDNVPESVYDNLVGTINANLPVLHEYYDLRMRALGLDELRHYDVYVPLVERKTSRHSYREAVDIVSASLAPLGEDYVATLRAGLLGGWVDRYENKGKRSGAFSAGSFSGEPYILLNYKENVLNDIFTMAHEGGHSMHSWHSVRGNPFMCYSYTIFEAEVASTFNEQLVFKYLYERAASDEERVSLLASRVDDTLATLFRQTMFAEYEAVTHAMAESGQALTVDSLRAEYRKLLEKYFGPRMKLESLSDLEGLRIPHFYNAFYVYKYSTGISASIALSERVLNGGEAEKNDYFAFLKSGGSRFPIEALKVAGVDMSSPEPVQLACARFANDVRTLKGLLKL
ncbi:MAG TPA: oligoendopeptidase F [Rectinemataceae bacterium]|nr:oligoendopeptidase F [Rectinemataceae bacterium]